ncbi:MAG: cytochrome c biogenesis heme-transporting ATPase CcmA [Burkholderiales bacterium]|nr:cytochrome c biogenesis heme-transporting ATPase CcmA [Burkholderiales bacterium]
MGVACAVLPSRSAIRQEARERRDAPGQSAAHPPAQLPGAFPGPPFTLPHVSDWPSLPPLEATGLRCERGERALFDGLELRLEPGEIVWLRGANGRGKTTLLRTLAGLGTAAAGELRLGGRPMQQVGPEWRRQLIYLGHANALKDDLSAAESLHFAARLAGTPASAAEVHAALTALGVGPLARRAVRTMSQGQRRRVALARLALAPKPALALLDEPFDALDDDGIERLARLLAGVAEAGGCVLFTSHQQIQRLRPAPRVVMLPEAPPGRAPSGPVPVPVPPAPTVAEAPR